MHVEVNNMCQTRIQFKISLDLPLQFKHQLSEQLNALHPIRSQQQRPLQLPQLSDQRALPRHEAILKVVQHENSCQLISQHHNQNISLMIRQ